MDGYCVVAAWHTSGGNPVHLAASPCRLTGLQSLVLSDCLLLAAALLEPLQRLTALDLSRTLCAWPPVVTSLRHLSMAGCRLGGEVGGAECAEDIWRR